MKNIGIRSVCALAVVGLLPRAAVGQEFAAQPRSAAQLGQILAEVPGIEELEISPDGIWVAYSISTKSVAENSESTRWWLQRVPQGNGPLPDAVALPEGARSVRFRPDDRKLSLLLDLRLLLKDRRGDRSARGARADDQGDADPGRSRGASGVILYDLSSGKLETVRVSGLAGVDKARPPQVESDYQWSPQGNFIAFTAMLPASSALDQRRGVPFDDWLRGRESRHGLFVLEIATGMIRQVTPERMNVATFGGFGWSPDERSLAVTIDHEGNSQGTNTDLIIVDRAGGKIRELVRRPGKDGNPTWSPDGRWIAFYTHDGEPSYWLGRPAIVPAGGGAIVDFGGGERPRGWWIGQSWWMPDSASFLYLTQMEMTLRVVRASVHEQTLQVLPMAASELTLPADREHVVSGNGRRMAFLRSSTTVPHELLVVDLDPQGRLLGKPRQLTALAPNFPLGRGIRTEIINWSSPDGQLTIHGLLLTPSAAWRDGRVRAPLPTALFSNGGPGMVRRDFATDSFHGVLLALVERGFAVLSANTRGRGGYGDALEQGIANSKTMLTRPFEDAMAGVELLIERGIADPDRLAVLGHSYGGSIAAYAVTQTTRFKGAVLHEPGAADMFRYHGYPPEPDSWRWLINRDLGGVHDPTDPAERATLLHEAPGLNANRVRTPTLMQFGVRSLAEDAGRPLCNTWRYFGIPTACFIYDEGHVFSRPAAVADDLTRSVEWLDHWVRGLDYPDAERRRDYEAWIKRANAVERPP